MTPAEREALPPLDVTHEERESFRADHEYKYIHSAEVTVGASLACRERQLLAKMSLISSLELTLSNSTNLNVMQMERISLLENLVAAGHVPAAPTQTTPEESK